MPKFKHISPSGIIHIFALLHAIVALGCRYYGVGDELLLTLLTMTMALLVCFNKNFSIEFTAAIIIVGNIIGFLMGTLGANILEMFIDSPYAVHALSTAATTEVLGWAIVALAKVPRPTTSRRDDRSLSSSSLKWILLTAGGIFIIRLSVVFFFSKWEVNPESIYDMTGRVLSNSVALLVLICINILYIRMTSRQRRQTRRSTSTLILCLFMIGATLLETVLVGIGFSFRPNTDFIGSLPVLIPVAFLAQVTVYCIVFMVNYAITAQERMRQEREKANTAQFRYLKLKRQVDPHFLFNSLNILDCLVGDDKPEQASEYIHKLAGLYRYMIKSEEEEIVLLRDELAFVEQYVDLLKVRFPEGFEVDMNVAEECMSKYVLPCSIQLLIENATKHNTVSIDNPLKISISASGNFVQVCNNIIPKVTKAHSMGLGHKYIRQQYLDISGKEIEIADDGNRYCVTLPLL
jgi:hypothetical protein